MKGRTEKKQRNDFDPFFFAFEQLLMRLFVFSQRQFRSNSEDINEFNQTMNRRTIVPPEQLNQHHYTSINPIQAFSYATQQPTLPRKSIQNDTDV
jgi:hypothetical protein